MQWVLRGLATSLVIPAKKSKHLGTVDKDLELWDWAGSKYTLV